MTRTVLFALVLIAWSCQNAVAGIDGQLQQWHRVTLTFDGPRTAEEATPNPFYDYRLNVTFTHAQSQQSQTVPGYYAADGKAAGTSAASGGKWRVQFAPSRTGTWQYLASFRTGPEIAISLEPSAGSAVGFDGASGSFEVAESDKESPDFRAKGLLQYVGEFYLRHAGNGEYFLKGGADSPENFLAYSGFDGTYDADADSGSYKQVGTFLHDYAPHTGDWRSGDPTWKQGQGTGIVGMLNYLSSEGMNSVYFLTYNLDGGDGRDTWVWTEPDVRDRFDCSKLDQWEIVFQHMDSLGLQLHVVTQETENDHNLGGSSGLNPIRKLYYRELVARFSHHLAVMWNLGEENRTDDADRKEIASYIRDLDPYSHPITVHTQNNKAPDFYNGILGDPHFEASSIQSTMDRYNRDAIALRKRSAEAGRKWVIFGDEQAHASHGVIPDQDDPHHDLPRKHALWGNLMGGGGGVESYFGHQFPHMDIDCEDWRSRNIMWDQTRHALEFFRQYLPFWKMAPGNQLTSEPEALCLAQEGEVYAVYLPNGGSIGLKLTGGPYTVRWYDPRSGGLLQVGTVESVKENDTVSLGAPPAKPEQDWVVLVRRQ